MTEIENLQLKIADLEQQIFSSKTDYENAEWHRVDNDLKFLKEIKEKLDKGFQGDYASREFALKMVDDWILELEGKVKQ